MSERPSRTPELSKGKQRELRRQQQKRAQKRNRVLTQVGIATAGLATLGGIVAGGIYASQDTNSSRSEMNEPALSPTVTDTTVKQIMLESVADVNKVFGTNFDGNFVNSRVIVTPKFETLSKQERDDWCNKIPCEEAVAFTTADSGQELIYFNKSLFEYIAYTEKTDQINLNDYTRGLSFNELWHFLNFRQEKTPISDEMMQAFIDVFGVEDPSRIKYIKSRGDKFFTAADEDDKGNFQEVNFFHTINEMNSTLFQGFMMNKIGKVKYFNSDGEEGRFGTAMVLQTDLISKIGPNTMATMEKMFGLLLANRNEDWIRLVGARFNPDRSQQLQTGLKILIAIDGAQEEEYKKLTSN